MKSYYFALIEFETEGVSQAQGNRAVAAMNELKDAFQPIGEASFYQVANGAEFLRVKKEIKQGLRK